MTRSQRRLATLAPDIQWISISTTDCSNYTTDCLFIQELHAIMIAVSKFNLLRRVL